MTTPLHALSIDVEDYFQVLNLSAVIDRDAWEGIELRCGDSTRRLLALLEQHGARATFFFLGWIAERLPELVAEVAAAGHEVGSHGYDHRLLRDLGPDGFREDLARTEEILERAAAVRPRVFRASTWSVTRTTAWALPILAERGYGLDSSIFPVRHPDYGIPGAPGTPYRLDTGAGELCEFPPLTWSVAGRLLPVGGGGYLRLLPTWMPGRALRQQERRGLPGCLYLHPWEIDPGQPRHRIGGLRGFRHYVNLARTETKLDRLLSRFRFVGLSEALEPVLGRLPLLSMREVCEDGNG